MMSVELEWGKKGIYDMLFLSCETDLYKKKDPLYVIVNMFKGRWLGALNLGIMSWNAD